MGLFAQKKGKIKDTTIVLTDVVTSEVEDVFHPPFLFFKEIKSLHKTASEWLNYIAQKVNSPDQVYVFDFYKSGYNETGNFVFYIYRKRDKDNANSISEDTSASQFYVVPLHKFQDTSWAKVHNEVLSEVKAFIRTNEFKNSKLANAKAILARYNDEVIWSNAVQSSPELMQLKEITIAIIDYYAQKEAGKMVWDGEDVLLESAVREKNKAEIYFVLGEEENLKKLFFEKIRYNVPNDSVNVFIKSSTGYDIDVYAEAKRNAELILKQNKIVTKEDAENARLVLRIYKNDIGIQGKTDSLKNLVNKYYEQLYSNEKKSTKPHSSLVKYYHKEIADIASPNGKYSVSIAESGPDKEKAQTSITLNIEKAGGSSIYYAKGTDLNIKAYWKNNNHLIIETKKSYEALHEGRRRELRHYNDVVKIEFIEK
jgi:ribosomal protein L31E